MSQFYNKYRPTRFGDVIAQKYAIEILQNQAKSKNFAHSNLCYGPSGSGKTTVARLIAMSAICQNTVDGEPCNECDDCRLIQENRHWDVIEIDCARFRGIDDVRELCFKSNFSPHSSHKVYILDEAQQLTEQGFAAMLKILEEPPPYLILVLTTTAIDRIPETIRSRCQLFPFKELKPDDIMSKLVHICEGEHLTPDPATLLHIAECAAGNCRAALNVLEQLTCAGVR